MILSFCDVYATFHLRQSVIVYSFDVDIRMWNRQTDKRTGLCNVSKKELGFFVTLTFWHRSFTFKFVCYCLQL